MKHVVDHIRETFKGVRSEEEKGGVLQLEDIRRGVESRVHPALKQKLQRKVTQISEEGSHIVRMFGTTVEDVKPTPEAFDRLASFVTEVDEKFGITGTLAMVGLKLPNLGGGGKYAMLAYVAVPWEHRDDTEPEKLKGTPLNQKGAPVLLDQE